MSEKICGADENAGCHCPRFEDIAQNCPWRLAPSGKFIVKCIATIRQVGKTDGYMECHVNNCALWYWKKK